MTQVTGNYGDNFNFDTEFDKHIDASEKNNFEKETRQIESDKSSNIGINYLATMAKYSFSSKEN